jgi:hypothetical protein
MVEKIKWIFYAFQGISGLQINFSKTKLIPLNISSADANFYCNILQCKLGKLPIKYLRVWLHWKKPNKGFGYIGKNQIKRHD